MYPVYSSISMYDCSDTLDLLEPDLSAHDCVDLTLKRREQFELPWLRCCKPDMLELVEVFEMAWWAQWH